MPGFVSGSTDSAQDSVVYADNVSFDGSTRGGMLTSSGQLLIGATAAPHIRVANLTPGPGIGIVNTDGNIQISSTGGTFNWLPVTSALNPIMLVGETGYICNGLSPVIFQLPPSCSAGTYFAIVGTANLWQIQQNAMQQIVYGIQASTLGVYGNLTATYVRDNIEMLCVADNQIFQLTNCGGNPDFN